MSHQESGWRGEQNKIRLKKVFLFFIEQIVIVFLMPILHEKTAKKSKSEKVEKQ
jgi:hypothetical protein